MLLSPMRYKDFVWPHNPRVYQIAYKRRLVAHKVPMGDYLLQDMGLEHRVLRGEGIFAGKNAYSDFRRLASLFYEGTAGMLIHPLWQEANARFAELELLQEPMPNWVKYSFCFWEEPDQAMANAKLVAGTGTENTGSEAVWYTVKWGDCLWNIARAYGTTVQAIVALNTQMRNPNAIFPGNVLRVR